MPCLLSLISRQQQWWGKNETIALTFFHTHSSRRHATMATKTSEEEEKAATTPPLNSIHWPNHLNQHHLYDDDDDNDDEVNVCFVVWQHIQFCKRTNTHTHIHTRRIYACGFIHTLHTLAHSLTHRIRLIRSFVSSFPFHSIHLFVLSFIHYTYATKHTDIHRNLKFKFHVRPFQFNLIAMNTFYVDEKVNSDYVCVRVCVCECCLFEQLAWISIDINQYAVIVSHNGIAIIINKTSIAFPFTNEEKKTK